MRAVAILAVLLAQPALGQPSYWFQGFQRQGNAQLAQRYFFLAGPGISLTWTNPYVYINATGTNIATATNATYAAYAQFATNWLGSNSMWSALAGNPFGYSTGTVGLSVTQFYNDLMVGTRSNVFSNGLLVASGSWTGPSLIQPAGLGYLRQPDGGSFLLP